MTTSFALAQSEASSDVYLPAANGVNLHANGSRKFYPFDPDGNSRGDRAGHDLSVALSPAAILGSAALLLDAHSHHGEARQGFEGMAATGLATVILKKAINETRPNGGGGSFPSGHASLAFSLATALTENHPHYKWLAYGAASSVAWARVEVDAHYWHDVVAGAAIGYFTTKQFMHDQKRLMISPQGIGVQKTF